MTSQFGSDYKYHTVVINAVSNHTLSSFQLNFGLLK